MLSAEELEFSFITRMYSCMANGLYEMNVYKTKDQNHMISPISGTLSTKQASKQNITRDSEIKNKLTVTRGEVGGHNRGKRGKGFQEHV